MLSENQAIYAANNLVPLPEVLIELGVEFRDVPCQLSCPVHKLGMEERPSAHLYEDNSLYCFTCAQQYGPVDVWSARRGIDLQGAALILLEKWNIPEVDILNVTRSITTPRRPTIPEGLLRNLEEALLEFRGHTSLTVYREWVKKIEGLSKSLAGLERRDQEKRLEFFRALMKRELVEAH